MNLFELAGGAVMEQVQAAAKRVFENIYDPNTEAKKPRKLVIELVFKPNENDRTDVDVSAVVKTTLLPRRAIHTKMIVEADNKGKIMADEYVLQCVARWNWIMKMKARYLTCRKERWNKKC